MIKDDLLGIGAKKGSENHECTGLDVFQDLLGRLNGKSQQDVDREKDAREKGRREMIVGDRYRMKFVLGEVYKSSDIDKLLEGQRRELAEDSEAKVKIKIEPKEEELSEEEVKVKINGGGMESKKERKEEGAEKKRNRMKKRKIKEEDEDVEFKEKRKRKKADKDGDAERKERKGERKGKDGNENDMESSGLSTPSGDSEEQSSLRSKKIKIPKDEQKGSTAVTDEESSGTKERKERRKEKEKKERKEKKEKERESKRDKKERDKKGKKEKEEKRDTRDTGDKRDKKKRKEPESVRDKASDTLQAEAEAETEAAVAAAARALTGRQAIRHRYIAAKRSSVMDVQALNEVRNLHCFIPIIIP